MAKRKGISKRLRFEVFKRDVVIALLAEGVEEGLGRLDGSGLLRREKSGESGDNGPQQWITAHDCPLMAGGESCRTRNPRRQQRI